MFPPHGSSHIGRMDRNALVFFQIYSKSGAWFFPLCLIFDSFKCCFSDVAGLMVLQLLHDCCPIFFLLYFKQFFGTSANPHRNISCERNYFHKLLSFFKNFHDHKGNKRKVVSDFCTTLDEHGKHSTHSWKPLQGIFNRRCFCWCYCFQSVFSDDKPIIANTDHGKFGNFMTPVLSITRPVH